MARRRRKAHRNAGAPQWYARYPGAPGVLGPSDLETLANFIVSKQKALGSQKPIEVAYQQVPSSPLTAFARWDRVPEVVQAVMYVYSLQKQPLTSMKKPYLPFGTGIVHLLPVPKRGASNKTPQEQLWDSLDRLEKRLKKRRFTKDAVIALNHAMDLLDDMIMEIGGGLNEKQLHNMAYKWGHAYEELECAQVSEKVISPMQRIAREAFKLASP